MKTITRTVLAASSLVLALGCSPGKPSEPKPAGAQPQAVAAPTQPAPAAAPAAPAADPTAMATAPVAAPAAGEAKSGASCGGQGGGAACGEHKAPEGGCGDESDPTQLTNPTTETVKLADGTTALHAGGAFAGAQAVKVSELLKNPEAYDGKTVAVEGDVSAMCHHKRSWFSLASEDKSGAFLRIMAAPTFLVPQGSIGKSARAEGTVKVIAVAAAHAQHLAAEHKLGEPAAVEGPVKQVVLQASGAEFK